MKILKFSAVNVASFISQFILAGVLPLLLAVILFGAYNWDFSIPFSYGMHDGTYHLVSAKGLLENGWIFENKYLGAPGVADWHFHAAAQTSALHSVIIKVIGFFTNDAIASVQYYYFLNFSLISSTTYVAFRLAKVNSWLALSAGFIFAFLNYRLVNNLEVLFLGSYFMIPLVGLVVYWSALGEFTVDSKSNFKEIVFSKRFLFSLLVMIVMGTSDGYYSFFTLLLLLFSALITLLNYGSRSLINFSIPIVFAGVVLAMVTALSFPIDQYKKNHMSEFYPNGKLDEWMIKKPFEAEVYSTSLKLLVAPAYYHRNELLSDISKKIISTNNEHKENVSWVPLHPLGFLGTIFLIITFSFLAIRKIDGHSANATQFENEEHAHKLRILAVLSLFVFLSSIYGGVGTIVALGFPTIRAYERFIVFLIFFNMLATYYFISTRLTLKLSRNIFFIGAIVLITFFAIWDQSPRYKSKYKDASFIAPPNGGDVSFGGFVAEKLFIQKLESVLPKGALVYQYPYSQFLDNNKYYKGGVSGHMRAYLHSKDLHWSNGASKNSPIDIWHRTLADSDLDTILEILPQYGFNAVLIDRAVVKDDEYALIKKYVRQKIGVEIINDDNAKMAYFILPTNGFTLVFDDNYKYPNTIFIKDVELVDFSKLPSYINKEKLKVVIESYVRSKNITLNLSSITGLFDKKRYDSRIISINTPLDKALLKGDLVSSIEHIELVESGNINIVLEIKNKSNIDWKLNSGLLPISIGYHIYNKDNQLLEWDNAYRVNSKMILLSGESKNLTINIDSLNLHNLCTEGCKLVFELVQDGNTWFGLNQDNKKVTIMVN